MTDSPSSTPNSDFVWTLSGRLEENGPIRLISINEPFQVGRRHGLALHLPSAAVSKLHAEISQTGDSLILRDFKSTNGTYVNGRPVRGELAVQEGDLIQFANVAFRLFKASDNDARTAIESDNSNKALSLVQFDKLMRERAVIPFFQPLIKIATRQTIGYEVLGRSRFFGLQSPREMFLAASQLNVEAELSRLFRLAGIQEGFQLPGLPHLFLNTHPIEVTDFGLMESLHKLRAINPSQPITLEIHEAAVTNTEMMQRMRDELQDLDIGLAYDDFGAGRSRLAELVQVRPDYLKFDMSLVRDLHRALSSQQMMLKSLVEMAKDLGIITLAEGVECVEEHDACVRAGFDMGQGYFYGKPRAAHATSKSDADPVFLV